MPQIKDLILPAISLPGGTSTTGNDERVSELLAAWKIQMNINDELQQQLEDLRTQKTQVDLQAIVKPINDRVKVLEDRPLFPSDLLARILAVEGVYVESDKAPNFDNKDWKIWIQTTKDFTSWEQTSTAIARIPSTNDGMELGSVTFALPDATSDDAIAISNGFYKIAVRGGMQFEYNPAKSVEKYHKFAFPGGIYSNVSYKLFNDAGQEISNGGTPIAANETARTIGTPFNYFPFGTLIKWEFRFIDTAKPPVIYQYSLVTS